MSIAADLPAAVEAIEGPQAAQQNVVDVVPAVTVGRRRRRRWGLRLAVAWLVVVALAAIFADLLPLHRYDTFTGLPPRTTPGWRLDEPLGTDATGRSVLARLVFGARQSLLVGVVAIAISVAIGTLLGLLAGYFRGRVDRVISVVLDALLSIPPLVLLLAIAAVGARNLTTVIGGLAVLGIASFARLVRANALALRDREYIKAARVMGASTWRIVFRELLPNVFPSVVSIVFLYMGSIIVAEGSLSFLGLGIPPPAPSWGGMIAEGRQWLNLSPSLVFIPSLCLVLTVLSSRRIGEHLRVHLLEGRR